MSAQRPPARRGLGRGLGSLIPTAPPESDLAPVDSPGAENTEATATAPGGQAPDSNELAPVAGAYFAELPLTSITPNHAQIGRAHV